MKLAVYCLKWHTIGGSVHDLVVEPLSPHFDVELIPWDGCTLAQEELRLDADVSLWFQFFPPGNALRSLKNNVWQPMWDNVRTFSERQWRRMSKEVRIVSFSQAAAKNARNAGLITLDLSYFKNPAAFAPADWSGDRVALYWNRTGLVSPEFLERFCETLNIDTLLFRPNVDPSWYPMAQFELPSTIGHTKVEVLPAVMERIDFWYQTARANVLIAPRLYEGAGMFFLEALARGCAVFAHDAPTMNEYITHKSNGYLLQSTWSAARILYSLRIRLWKRAVGGLPKYHFPIDSSKQNWAEIAALDLEHLGSEALTHHHRGHAEWQASIPQYVDFLRASVH